MKKTAGASKPAAKTAAKQGTKNAAKPAAKDGESIAKKVEKKPPAPTPPKTINIKSVKGVLEDPAGEIAQTGKWPIIVDPSERVNTFLRYAHANFFSADLVTDMRAEVLRQGLLGSIKHGRIFCVSVPSVKEYETLEKVINEIHPDLMTMVLDKSIVKEENFMKITKETDGDDYKWHAFPPENVAAFRCCIVTSDPGLPSNIMNMFAPIIIEE